MVQGKGKLRVAIITTQAFSLINFRGVLVEDLLKLGIDVYAFAPDYTNSLSNKIRKMGGYPINYDMNRTTINPILDFLHTVKLTLLIRKYKPDVCFCYFIKPVIFGSIASWLAGTPRIISMIEGLGYTFTDDATQRSLWRKSLLKTIVKYLYGFSLARCNRVIFLNSDDLYEFVDESLVEKDSAIKLGGIGVDLDYWCYQEEFPEELTFLMAARILKEKGVVEFSEAAKCVKKEFPNIKFVLIGEIDSNPGALTRDEVSRWVHAGILEWPGYVDMKLWLKKASVFVLPSYREGVPRSTQEAMAMGRPVITTEVPGCRDTVADGVNGFLVPPRNVNALVSAMLHFQGKPALLKKFGRESRRMAETRYDVKKINKQIIKIMLNK